MEQCPPPIRGSGRTQWMIDQICDAVKDGQPQSRVFGHNEYYATVSLKKRVVEGLAQRRMAISRVARDRIDVEGSVITFHSIQCRDMLMYGATGFGDFVDHCADGES